MSFEGYYQVLCKNHHCDAFDCYIYEPELWSCPLCAEPAIWWNLVDVTNGSYCTAWDDEKDCCTEDPPSFCKGAEREECIKLKGRIDGYIKLVVDKEAEYDICPHCGRSEIISHTTYRIPAKGHKKENV